MNTVFFKNLGLIDFKDAWGTQEGFLQSIIDDKKNKRKTRSYLLFCQHPHVYTLGKSGNEKNLLVDKDCVDFYKINRGGDITYHGPGQLVVYPIFDLDTFFTDIHKYLRFLEKVVIRVLQNYSLKGFRVDGATGVWLKNSQGSCDKICAMGVRASRWVTMHGLAFNICVDLDYFKNIIPCGISNKGVTSLDCVLGRPIDFSEIEEVFKAAFTEVFNINLIDLK